MQLHIRIREEIEKTNIKLLSQIMISDKEYEYLLDYARSKMRSIFIQTITPTDLILSLALVQIAIREYAEGNYWDTCLDALNVDVTHPIRNYIGQIFVTTLRQFKLFVIDNESSTINQYVENIKAHSFVPNNYLNGYFDFLFSFYDRNLFRRLPDDLTEDIDELREYMTVTRAYGGDQIRLEKTQQRAAKAYRLMKATRWVLSQCEAEVVTEILSSHLQLIDRYYYDGDLPSENERFSVAFLKWYEQNNEEIKLTRKKQTGESRGIFNYKPYFEVERSTGRAKLIIPQQKFREQDFKGTASVTVTNSVSSNIFQLDMYRAFGVVVSEQISVPADDIFNEISVELTSSNTKRFVIPAKDYRIFDGDWNELSRLKSGHCYVLTEKNAKLTHNNAELIYSTVAQNWNEYSFSIRDNTVLYINTRPVSTAGEFSEEPIFEYVSKEYQLFDMDGRAVQTAWKHPIVSFKIHINAIKGSFLWCNEERFNIEIPETTSIIELHGNDDYRGVSVVLSNLLVAKDGLYTIVLDEAGKGKRIICQYALITRLRLRPEKRRFVFCETAKITVSGNYDLAPMNCERINESEYLLNLTTGNEFAEFSLELHGIKYTARVPINVFKYRFSQDWQYARPEYWWHTKLMNILYVSIPGASAVSAYLDRDEQYAISGEQIGEAVFKLDISDFVRNIREQKKAWRYLNLKYIDTAQRNLPLLKVLTTLWIEKLDFRCEDDDILLDVAYKGDAKLLVSFIDYYSKNPVVENRVLDSEINYFPELNKSSLYTLNKKFSEPDEFGFSQNITELKPIYKIGAINYSDLSNCKIVIDKIAYAGEELSLDYDYSIWDLVKVDDYEYNGRLTSKSRVHQAHAETLFPKVKITLHSAYGDIIFLHMYIEESLDWAEIWYDRNIKKLISAEDDILVTSRDHKRFIPLYEDEVEYVAEIRRVK